MYVNSTVEPCYLERLCVEFRDVSKVSLKSCLFSFFVLYEIERLCRFSPFRSFLYVEVISQVELAVNLLIFRNFLFNCVELFSDPRGILPNEAGLYMPSEPVKVFFLLVTTTLFQVSLPKELTRLLI